VPRQQLLLHLAFLDAWQHPLLHALLLLLLYCLRSVSLPAQASAAAPLLCCVLLLAHP
jgi:hypothetical protein